MSRGHDRSRDRERSLCHADGFRRALSERIKAAAASRPWTIQQLQRQVVSDRPLERLSRPELMPPSKF